MIGAADECYVLGDLVAGHFGSCDEGNNGTEDRVRGKRYLTVAWGDRDAATSATFAGREAQTLALLIRAGPRGFTSGEASPLGWARRTSSYIFKLRAAGLTISTTWEEAGDAYVGRYRLETQLRVLPYGAAQ